jgi:uncharacterized LabA/DUF88 family protein
MQEKSVAVLIDADNASAKFAAEILEEAGRYGRVTIRRMYGDWTDTRLKSWKKKLNELGIEPKQQFAYTVGKNATDSSLIIDAMDLLHSGRADVFCLVSSDSDFTGLASRLREDGRTVVGIGEKKTPIAFVRRCDAFVYVENLSAPQEKPSPSKRAAGETNHQAKRSDKKLQTQALSKLQRAYDLCENDEGFALFAWLGNAVQKVDPSFDVREYGQTKLKNLVAAHSKTFELVPHPDRPGVTVVRRR